MVFYIIGLILIIYSFKDFKKSFFLYIGFKFFLNPNITIISIPGIPQLSLDLGLMIFYFFMFFTKKKKLEKAKISFPLITPFIILIISSFSSSLFSIAGFGAELSNSIKIIFLDYLAIIMMWEMIEDNRDYDYLFKIISIVILVSCIYAVVEYALQYNPLSLYEMTLNGDETKIINSIYEINGRGYRVNSIFEHAIGAGITWALYVDFTLYAFVFYKNKIKIKPYHFCIVVLAIVCVFLTKMRSCMIFLVIASVGLVNFKKKRSCLILTGVIIACIIVVAGGLMPDEIVNIIKSITQSKYQTEVSGSTVEMRIDQFSAAFELMKINPIFGLGYKFQNVLSNSVTKRLYGSESIWLIAITRYGIIGVLSEIVYFYYLVIKIPKSIHSKPLFWISLAYFLTFSITTLPGLIMPMFYFTFIFCVKNSNKYSRFSYGKRLNEWKIKGKNIIHRKSII